MGQQELLCELFRAQGLSSLLSVSWCHVLPEEAGNTLQNRPSSEALTSWIQHQKSPFQKSTVSMGNLYHNWSLLFSVLMLFLPKQKKRGASINMICVLKDQGVDGSISIKSLSLGTL